MLTAKVKFSTTGGRTPQFAVAKHGGKLPRLVGATIRRVEYHVIVVLDGHTYVFKYLTRKCAYKALARQGGRDALLRLWDALEGAYAGSGVVKFADGTCVGELPLEL